MPSFPARMHRRTLMKLANETLASFDALPRCVSARICLPVLFTRLGNRVNHPANRICPYSGPVGSIRAQTRNEQAQHRRVIAIFPGYIRAEFQLYTQRAIPCNLPRSWPKLLSYLAVPGRLLKRTSNRSLICGTECLH